MTYKEIQAARENGTVLFSRVDGEEVFAIVVKVWRDPMVGRVAKVKDLGGLTFFYLEENWEDLRTATAEELLMDWGIS